MDLKAIQAARAEASAKTLEFFRTFEAAAVRPALEEARRLTESERQRDRVYRIFHDSFKMYELGAMTLELGELMLRPLGFRVDAKGERSPLEQVIAQLSHWRIDAVASTLLREAVETRWSRERNAPELWLADTRKLTAGYLVICEVALATLEAMARMIEGTGFLWTSGVLNSTDALFLEAWKPLGLALRYRNDDDLYAECRSILSGRRDDAQ